MAIADGILLAAFARAGRGAAGAAVGPRAARRGTTKAGEPGLSRGAPGDAELW